MRKQCERCSELCCECEHCDGQGFVYFERVLCRTCADEFSDLAGEQEEAVFDDEAKLGKVFEAWFAVPLDRILAGRRMQAEALTLMTRCKPVSL